MRGLIKILLTALATVATLQLNIVHADDTDIYVGNNPPPPGAEPMVMFTLDYRPNLGSTACNAGECASLIAEGWLPAVGPYTFFDVLRAVLAKVMEPLGGVRVGLMMSHDYKNGCANKATNGCSNGGYVLMGFERFEVGDVNGAKARFRNLLASVPTPQGGRSHAYQGKEVFFELFRYLTGQGVYNGHVGFLDFDPPGTTSKNLNQDWPAIMWDTGIESGNNYISPINPLASCSKIFTVNIMFQVSQQDADSDDVIDDPRASGGTGAPRNDFNAMIEFLHDADLAGGGYGAMPNIDGKQNVTSFFIVDPTKINTTTIGYARAGGTGQPLPLDADPQKLINTLQDVLKQILSISTTFVAASIPANVFNRAEVVDNVYLALFQADQDNRPFWPGNVKKLKLAGLTDGTNNVHLVDALGQPAVGINGRIRFDALTFWTDAAALPPADPDLGEVPGRDGRSVPRGAAGQKLPGYISGSPGSINGVGRRYVYYDSAGNLKKFEVNSTVASELQLTLGALTTLEAEKLIGYARGLDVDDLDGDGITDEARPWIFSDPLHSRPLPINYGAKNGHTDSNPLIYIAVGSNDGFMRFIRNTSSSGSEIGTEEWAFMPRAVMNKIRVLRNNSAGVKHPYMVDGAPVSYIKDINNNGTIDGSDKVWLFFGLRRGGRAYYALDVTDPQDPKLMWTIQKSGDFAELGHTFSDPRIGRLDLGSGPKPVVVFGGGYDMNKDLRLGVGVDDLEGNAIYVVDAETGALIWKAKRGSGSPTATVYQHPDLRDSIPSSLAAVDTDGNGLLDRIVVGDTGGNVWRADLAGNDTSKWTLTRLAALGRHSGLGGKVNDRRFFHRPDIVPSKDGAGPFDAVVIGSGDRADPLDGGGTVDNYLYMIKDRQIGVGGATDTGWTHGSFGDVTDNCLQQGSSCSVDLARGWRLRLETTGEKSLSTPLTIAGTVFFTTYIPSGGSSVVCGPAEGSGRLWAVSLQDARAINNYDSTVSDLNKDDRYVTLNSGGIPAEVVAIPPNRLLRPDLQIESVNTTTRWRTFWYEARDSNL